MYTVTSNKTTSLSNLYSTLEYLRAQGLKLVSKTFEKQVAKAHLACLTQNKRRTSTPVASWLC